MNVISTVSVTLLGVSLLAAFASGQAPCGPANCLTYDGVDDYVFVQDSPSLSFQQQEAFTVEAWVRTTILPPAGPPYTTPNPLPSIIEKWNSSCFTPYSYALRLNISGQITGSAFSAMGCQMADSVVWGNPAQVSDGVWHHVAYTRDGSGLHSLWIDGQLIDTDSNVPAGPTVNTEALLIGRRGPGGAFTNFWTGQIDEVRISDVARYTTTFRPSTWHASDMNTRLLLHFDEGMGQFAFDSSSFGNDAQLGSAGLPGSDDPTWSTGFAPNYVSALFAGVNQGPFDSSSKTFSGGDFIRFGIDGGCSPALNGRLASILLNLGPDAIMTGVSPIPSVEPALEGFETLNFFSMPQGSAYVFGDGLNVAMQGAGEDFGLGTYTAGQAPYAIPTPVGVFPVGFPLRFQAVFEIPESPPSFLGVTNSVTLTAQ